MKLTCSEKTTLKDFTDNNYAQGSFFWSYLLKNKEIKVNGKKVGANVELQVGDLIVIFVVFVAVAFVVSTLATSTMIKREKR